MNFVRITKYKHKDYKCCFRFDGVKGICPDRRVTRNVREAKAGKFYHKSVQHPRARVVNSESCVLLKDKLDDL